MREIILITGGQRSGKSSYGEKLALELAGAALNRDDAREALRKPIYLATARIWDDEFARRVRRHQAGREVGWENLEEEKQLSRHNVAGRVVLVDCVTLWATNFFFDVVETDGDLEGGASCSRVELALEQLKAEFDAFTAQEAIFIFVTNEIGMGEVSQNKVQRQFTDLQGWLNQYIATQANRVVWMVSGIPVTIKSEHDSGG